MGTDSTAISSAELFKTDNTVSTADLMGSNKTVSSKDLFGDDKKKTPIWQKVGNFFTGMMPYGEESEAMNRPELVNGKPNPILPESASVPFLQDPVTAASFGLVSGAKAASPLLGKALAAGRETLGWMTGGASEVPSLVKGGGKAVLKSMESKNLALAREARAGKPFAEVPIKASAEKPLTQAASETATKTTKELTDLKPEEPKANVPIDKTINEAETTLQSAVLPGAKEVIEPVSQNIARTFKSAANDFKRIFTPLSMGKEAQQTGAIMRENLAKMAHSGDMADTAMKSARKDFGKLDFNAKIDFMDKMEAGGKQTDTNLQSVANTIRTFLDEKRTAVTQLGTNKLKQFNENYFPHIWQDTEEATKFQNDWYSRRPMEGSKSFLKKRSVPTIKDGLQWRVYDKEGLMTHSVSTQKEAEGLVGEGGRIGKPLTLVSDNPVDLTLLKLREMDKYVMAHKTINEMKGTGLAKFVKATKRRPDGWVKIDDKIATVFAPKDLQGVAGQTILGHYYAPENAAAIINNYLKPGLRNKEWFRGYLGLSNMMNQFQLGFSAFHLGFTSVDASVSKVALGLNQLLGGSPIKGIKSIVESPIAPLTTIMKGNKVLKEWFKPGSQGAEIAKIVDGLQMAGGRVRMDSFYRTTMTEKMVDAFRANKFMGTLWRLPFAAVEQSMRPIMEQLVPRQKLGVFMDIAKWEMEKLEAKGAGRDEVRAVMQKAWDSVDNRMGQLVYDNLFWNKITKDMGMASVRSLGWNLGTFRELGGGAVDLAKQVSKGVKGQRPEMTYRMAYTMALPIVVGTMGAITNYLMTGEPPQELKDYFFPRTGRIDNDGLPERISFPSYMKDVYNYYNHPVKTLENKLHPEISVLADMFHNTDYYVTEITNGDDPLIRSLLSQFQDSTSKELAVKGLSVGLNEAEYQAKQMAPFSAQGAAKNIQKGTGLGGVVAPFVGVMPAPKNIERSDIQNLIYDTLEKRKGQPVRSQVEFDKAHARQEIGQLFKEGDPAKKQEFEEKVKEAVEKGYIENDQSKLNTLLEHAVLPGDIKAFEQLPADDQTRLIAKMTPQEVNKYAWYAHNEVKEKMGDLSPATESFVNEVNSGKLKQPTYASGGKGVPQKTKEWGNE